MPDIDRLKSVSVGTIQMWSGLLSDIPQKWQICDGTNGTPNLLDKFIKGAPAGQDAGATGGESTHILTESELPSHSHSISTSSHSHTIPVYPEFPQNTRTDIVRGSPTTPFTWASTTANLGSDPEGGSLPHENNPPFFEIIYIQRIEK